ncbi:MAG: glycosyltransferase, partial [Firmicutes bacterium]|nr:glycosyltransferase [Bacillota bacterium]
RGLVKRGYETLYVDSPVTWLSPIKDRATLPRFTGTESVAPAEAGVDVLRPPVFAPFGSMHRALNVWNQARLARSIRDWLGGQNQTSYVLYSWLPTALDLLPHLPGNPIVVYDCVDDHAAFHGFINSSYIRDIECAFAGHSNVVIATAQSLFERMSQCAARVLLAPNGVHAEHFTPTPDTRAAAAKLRSDWGANVVVGFVGGIGDWIDIELIAQIAASRPEWTFVLIGPVLTDIAPLSALQNVRLLGPRPYKSLPAYVQAFDVGLSPFRINELTASVNPVKVYEYLAAEVEVVATPMRELLAHADVIHLAQDAAGFSDHIQAIVDGARCDAGKRAALVAASLWNTRIEQIFCAIEEAFH